MPELVLLKQRDFSNFIIAYALTSDGRCYNQPPTFLAEIYES